MVAEDHARLARGRRHRGPARRDINSASVGIEIHNPGHELGYPEFPEAQLAALEALCADIIARHGIRPERVLAHSDVAPTRKKDPGEKFPWARLARDGHRPLGDAGAGQPRPTPALPATPPARWWRTCRPCCASYGYGIEATGGFDPLTEFVVTAFQRHFRPERVDGRIDQSTITTLERLAAALPARRPCMSARPGRAARGWPGRSIASTCAPCWC